MTDATSLAAALRAGTLRADEVASDAYARIEAIDPLVRAVATIDPPAAFAPGRPLSGVPFLMKDLLGVAGRPCSFGSRMYRGFVAQASSPFADAIARSGVRALGRTTTSELGLLGSTEAVAYGAPTVNPWDRTRSATGSSGGAAVAVATGMVPIAHASDGGGSIRIPASVTGTFGFKPSRGRCPPSLPAGPVDLVVEHCITRSVRDSLLFLEATSLTPLGEVAPAPARLRIALYRQTLMGEDPSPEVTTALDRVVLLLRGLGHTVEEVPRPPVDGAPLSAGFFMFAGYAVAAAAMQARAWLGRRPGPDDLEPFSLTLMSRALRAGADAMPEAAADMEAEGRRYVAWLSSWDVALCPTTPDPPPPIGHLGPTLDYDTLLRRTERLAGYTAIHNVAGVPAMSVPLAWADGLPVGAHFAAAPMRDGLLMSLALELEAAAPWADRWPPLAGVAAPR